MTHENDGDFEKFAAELTFRVSELDGAEKAIRDDDDMLRLGEASINLQSIYRAWMTQPPELRGDQMDRYIRMVADSLTAQDSQDVPFDEISAQLRPKLWSRWMFAASALESISSASGGHFDMPTRLVGDHLILSLVQDMPDSMSSISWSMFSRWGVTFDEAIKVAIDNADQATQMLGANAKEGRPGQCVMATQDNYDSSRFLSEVPYEQFGIDYPRWVFSPARDTCVICQADQPDQVESLVAMAFTTAEDDLKPLPPFPIVDHGKGFVTWRPDSDHPALRLLAKPQHDYLMQLYQEQTYLLRKTGHLRKDFALVQPLEIDDASSTETFPKTITQWVAGTECLLPEADVVVFPDRDGRRVDWQKLLSVCGDQLAPGEAIYPPRWRTDAFPSEEKFSQF